MSRDYAALQAAEKYTVVADPDGEQYEPTFVVGEDLDWTQTMQSLIDWNVARGNTERAEYLKMCQNDKAYYFADI